MIVKQIIFLLILNFTFGGANAQNASKIDSLWKAYGKSNSIQNKISIKSKLILLYINNSKNDTALLLANENFNEISLTKNNNLLLLNNYKKKGIIYSNKKNRHKSTVFFEKALKAGVKEIHSKDYIEVLYGFAHFEILYNNFDKADSLLNIALKIISTINETSNKLNNAIASVYKTKSLIFIRKQTYFDSARYYINLCIPIYQKLEDKKLITSSYINYGYTYAVESKLDSGVVYFVKALKVAEKHNLYKQQTTCLENIGIIYHMLYQYEKAYFYYKKSEKLAVKLNSGFRDKSSIYASIANIFIDRKQIDSLNKLIPKILSNQDSLYSFDKVHPYIVLSSIYILKNNIDSAYYFSQKAKSIIEKNNSPKNSDYNTINYLEGKYFEQKKMNSKAIQRYHEALINCKSLKLQADINKALYHIYKSKKNNIKSLYHVEQYTILNDSLNKIQNIIAINDATTRYETEKKEAENQLLKAKNSQQLAFSKSETLKKKGWIGTAIAALLIMLSSGLWFKQKQTSTQQKLVMQKQEFTQKIEKQENKNLQEILNALEEERTRIAQDLHDKIGAGISTAKLYFEGIKEMVGKGDKNIEKNFNKVDDILAATIGEVRNVSRNITSGVLADFGLMSALFDLAETVSNSGQITASFTHSSINGRLEKNIEINVYRIIQELVSNSIKHAECSKIDIQINQNNQQLMVSYMDNGKGFNAKTQSNGQGNKNIYTRVQGLNGSMLNKSELNKGAFYTFAIPLNNPLFKKDFK